ncbi:MAG: hypothetical protein WC072_09325 [Methanoregulaceae archaeon]
MVESSASIPDAAILYCDMTNSSISVKFVLSISDSSHREGSTYGTPATCEFQATT